MYLFVQYAVYLETTLSNLSIKSLTSFISKDERIKNKIFISK